MDATHFPIPEGIGRRLKMARIAQGLSQAELADIGGITRQTQQAYEESRTSPNTNYLSKIQRAGLDIHFILFAKDSAVNQTIPNWEVLIKATELVDIRLFKVSRNYPPTLRWQLIKDVYAKLISQEGTSTLLDQKVPALEDQRLVDEAWDTLVG